MGKKRLERIVERPADLKFGGHIDLCLARLADLYESHSGIQDITPVLHEVYYTELLGFDLRRKIEIFHYLRDKGDEHTKAGEIQSASYFYKISRYFWQNFVVIEGGK